MLSRVMRKLCKDDKLKTIIELSSCSQSSIYLFLMVSSPKRCEKCSGPYLGLNGSCAAVFKFHVAKDNNGNVLLHF